MPEQRRRGLRIGKLAQRADTSTNTIRSYERLGLLDPPQRTAAPGAVGGASLWPRGVSRDVWLPARFRWGIHWRRRDIAGRRRALESGERRAGRLPVPLRLLPIHGERLPGRPPLRMPRPPVGRRPLFLRTVLRRWARRREPRRDYGSAPRACPGSTTRTCLPSGPGGLAMGRRVPGHDRGTAPMNQRHARGKDATSLKWRNSFGASRANLGPRAAIRLRRASACSLRHR